MGIKNKINKLVKLTSLTAELNSMNSIIIGNDNRIEKLKEIITKLEISNEKHNINCGIVKKEIKEIKKDLKLTGYYEWPQIIEEIDKLF